MKWLMNWELEDEDGNRTEMEGWANTWEEAVGNFVGWISKSSNVIKGQIVCYWGDKPYIDDKPCLYFNVSADGK